MKSVFYVCARGALAAFLASGTLLAAQPGESDLSLSLGASAWHGDFGAPTKTDIASVLLGARYTVGRLRLTATLPYMSIRSDGTFFTGLGGTPLFVAPNVAALKRKRDGFGDATLGAAYAFTGAGSPVDVELVGRVKLPTASDASQLSTGKADYSAGVNLARTFGGVTPILSGGYRFYGDTDRFRFRNGAYTSAGASVALGARTTLLATYDFTQAPTRLIGDAHELVAALSMAAGPALRLTGYTSAGLSNGAAAISGGLSLSTRF